MDNRINKLSALLCCMLFSVIQSFASESIYGDVDGSGMTDIKDVTALINHLLSGEEIYNTSGNDIDVDLASKLGRPQCICHAYGSVQAVKENTISYFRKGIGQGFNFFEVDAVNCADGVPVCSHVRADHSYTVYGKTDVSRTPQTIDIQSLTSTDLVENYTWTAPTVDGNGNITAYGEPIALLSDVIWYVCYFHHCLLHVDGQGMTKASRLAASQYANSLGVGQYVFHELQGGAYTDWEIPCNAIIRCTSAEDIINKAATYKKNGNNIIFYYSSTSGDTTDEKLHSLAEAAHSVGCYTMSWTFNKVDQTRRWFKAGFDFLITSGASQNNIVTITNNHI